MALIKCLECGKEISDRAASCPNCGAPNVALRAAPPAGSTAAANPTFPQTAQNVSSSATVGQSYVDRNLLSGEHVVYRTKLHWTRFVGGTLLMLLFLGCAVGAFLLGNHQGSPFLNYLGVGFLIAMLVTALPVIIVYMTSEFAVTNKRVLIKVGFIQRTSFEVLLKQVESILVEQGILGRMLGFGEIIVIGTGGSKEAFDYITNPLEFRKQVQSQIAAQ